MIKVSSEIKRELARRGFRTIKEGARFIGISPEALRLLVNKDHIPKDRTLRVIAVGLGLDVAGLLLAAHREKFPDEIKGLFLSPVASPYKEGKRKYPLSQEQCDYLGKHMIPAEIQLVRKYRQFNGEGKTQFIGYLDYHFTLHRAALQNT
ncbi:MAG TPA: hypothetical protein VN604_01970 [Nitrospirota bacterium]|nr:hypothetical protein [Nitrospirota bacterium]